jgi:hypothetical protein
VLHFGTTFLRQDLRPGEQSFKPFIRQDLTMKQRQADWELREELRRRKQAGETNLIIRRGQIQAREPTTEN